MLKSKAIQLLGGTVPLAAQAMGVSYQAVDKWPEELPPRIAQRVLGVIAHERYPELAAELASAPVSSTTAQGVAHG